MISNDSYKEDGKLYIDFTIKNLDNVANTTYFLGRLSQDPGVVKTVFARTEENHLLAGWIDGSGYINLYNRTNYNIPAGTEFSVMCVVHIKQ
ncbi:hypothetical protein LXJ15735_36520 [Lacrimispora xylanolytica]